MPPFITSSLQMEASRKLGISAAQTMRLAQGLYEQVLLPICVPMARPYPKMRWSKHVELSKKIMAINIFPMHRVLYKSKAKNAQEAHEAIRPTDLSKLPKNINTGL